MSNDVGGPAFACAAENGHQEGMSLRDYFAGQAIVGKASSIAPSKSLAKWAYDLAESMIAEKQSRQQGEKK